MEDRIKDKKDRKVFFDYLKLMFYLYYKQNLV